MQHFGRQEGNLIGHPPDHFHQQPALELSGCWQSYQMKPIVGLRTHTERSQTKNTKYTHIKTALKTAQKTTIAFIFYLISFSLVTEWSC
jgi:hypothetical protein